MYARATDGNLPNNVKFSECSKRSIARVLNAKSGCFRAETSYCGNKVTSQGKVYLPSHFTERCEPPYKGPGDIVWNNVATISPNISPIPIFKVPILPATNLTFR